MKHWTPILLTGCLLTHACGEDLVPRDDGMSPADVTAGPSRDPESNPVDEASNPPARESSPSEILVSLVDGAVLWLRSDGTLVRRIEGGTEGPAYGIAFDASFNIYVAHAYSEDLATGNTIQVFDPAGEPLGQFGTGYDCNPHSMVFDEMGQAFVGQADCEEDILRFDAQGALLDSFDVATEVRGASWIAFANRPCIMLYTSQGPHVKRYNFCTGEQISDFNAAALPTNLPQGSAAYDLKVLPDGRVLVANFTEIVLLDALGIQLRVYDLDGPDGWRALDADLDGTSFWAINYSTSDIVRFDLASGDVLARFNSGTGLLTVKGVAVKPPLAAQDPSADEATR